MGGIRTPQAQQGEGDVRWGGGWPTKMGEQGRNFLTGCWGGLGRRGGKKKESGSLYERTVAGSVPYAIWNGAGTGWTGRLFVVYQWGVN